MNLNSLPLEYIIIAMAMVILYLIYYVYTKDTQYNRNIRSIASVVDELHKELFYTKKRLKETQNSVKEHSRTMSDDEIYQEIERSVYDMIQPLSHAIQQVRESVEAIDHRIESRVANLESGVKQINIPSSIHANDDEKIISLYKQGIAIETIAKELHLSKPEVEFVLKINKIK